MSWLEIISTAAVLSLDITTVITANAGNYRGKDMGRLFLLPVLFGFVQAILAVTGYFILVFTGLNPGIFSRLALCLILSFIGFRIIFAFFRPDNKKTILKPDLPALVLVAKAFYTGADSFAVGIGLAAAGSNILIPSIIFYISTLVFGFVFLFYGRRIGTFLGNRILLTGGIILIAIGIKTLF